MSSDTAAIAIVPFQERYGAAVLDLILPIQQQEFEIPITAADQPDLRDIAGFYQRGSGNFWLALHGERVVGTIALVDIGAGQAALRKMFVQREFRGAPFRTAQLLLATLLEWARSRELRAIYLGTTAKFLAAHRFYEKSGFQEIARDALPPQFPLMAVDTKFYAYQLSAAPHIRPIRASELPQLLDLYTHLHTHDAPLPEQDALAALWESIVRDPRLLYVVAEIDGRLAATCTLTTIPNLTRGARPYGLIENVVTHPDYRRQGLGQQVLRYALGHAWSQGCYKVMLLTGSKDEATLRFYERAGFARGIKTGFIATPDR